MYDRKNPIPAGAGVRLPGSIQGAETAWKVTSPGVHEYLLVVASPDPLKDLEKDLASIPAPETGRAVTSGPVHLAKPLGEILRGVGGLETVRKPAGAGRMADVVRRLGGRETGVSGIWIRKVVFNNPR